MPTVTPGHVPRSKGEALLDLSYIVETCVLNQRFNDRVDKAIAFISLLAGSAAFVTLFHPNSVVVTVSGLLVGVLTLAAQVYDFRSKAAAHGELLKRYMRIKEKSGSQDLAALDASIARVSKDSIPVVQGLKKLAYNNNVMSHGYESFVRPLNRWEKLLALLV